jgi:hypothetical protein
MSDEKLEQIVAEYADLAKDKNIDASALLINALEQEDVNKISTSTKRWAYLISIGVPPLGLLFAAWFYFGDKSDGKSTAIACTILTIVSGIISLLLIKAIFSGSGVSPEQIQQIKPTDIYELGS